MSQVYKPQPIGGAPAMDDVFQHDGEDRVEYMRRLGARNTEPPLPHSSHLKIKASGRILPWDTLLATQNDLVECCDENGNTDPDVWKLTVKDEPYDPDANKKLMMQAQATALAQAEKMSNEHRVEDALDMSVKPMTSYPQGVVSYKDLDSISPDKVKDLMNSME